MKNFSDHSWMMKLALEEADEAYKMGEVPVGAVIVSPTGEILAKAYNLKEQNFDPCAHAEILAIREACAKLKNWRLEDCRLYVTLEPCPMCLNAILQARVGQLFFGAYDPKGGAISLSYNFYKDQRLNHTFAVMGGLSHISCSKILSRFFRERRKNYKR